MPPLSLGSIGGGVNPGIITIPDTGGLALPGVDTQTIYVQGFTISIGGSPVAAEATVTHHDVVLPGGQAYRNAGLAVVAAVVTVGAVVLQPEDAPEAPAEEQGIQQGVQRGAQVFCQVTHLC
jgi:hypothetical protein